MWCDEFNDVNELIIQSGVTANADTGKVNTPHSQFLTPRSRSL